ncbi:MAG TPA: SIS domain-containing protein [Steroidobacteraceae bacterium]|nr:SIS domain-containing protein [Steroidobacteraceae bacterium]
MISPNTTSRPESTSLFREAAQAAAIVRQQFAANESLMGELGARLRGLGPKAVVTCARGSSDHAATFAKYLIETRLGLVTASAAPSVSSLYEAQPQLRDMLLLAISQSGASPDLLAAVDSARAAGSLIVALVNAESSPLARAADIAIPLRAGEERSVAATKSYIASIAAVIHLVAAWAQDGRLLEQLRRAAESLERAWERDWSSALSRLQGADHLFVVGRGLGLGIAQEAALKLKETCGIHAEALSAAELRHGPIALVKPGFPVLIFAQSDETHASVESLAAEIASRGAEVVIAGARAPQALVLPSEEAPAAIQPMLLIQSFYRLVNSLALARGYDPDRPPHLRKITETV